MTSSLQVDYLLYPIFSGNDQTFLDIVCGHLVLTVFVNYHHNNVNPAVVDNITHTCIEYACLHIQILTFLDDGILSLFHD